MRSVWDREVGGSNPLAPTKYLDVVPGHPANTSFKFLRVKFLARGPGQNPDYQGRRLCGIDALRGAAALAVVLYHTVGPKGQSEPLVLQWIAAPFLPVIRLGYVGVLLFFVISGFCIHLARARAQSDGGQPMSFTSFWKRRIRRLYPPYLIALMLFLLIAGFTTNFQATAFYLWDLLLHLLMLHNLDARTVYSVNGVFWTLAIEEQLYVAYFLLLFLRNRWGWGRTLVVCLAARVIWFIVFTALRNHFNINIPISESAASYWFNWALGAMSVEAVYGLVKLPAWSHKMKVAGVAVAGSVGLSYLLPAVQNRSVLYSILWLCVHPLWAVAFFVVLNWFVAAEKTWRINAQTPVLIRYLAVVGVFSYSLYLTHELVALEEYRFAFLNISPLATAFLLTTPVAVAFAWLFFQFAERPYHNTVRIKAQPSRVFPEVPTTIDA